RRGLERQQLDLADIEQIGQQAQEAAVGRRVQRAQVVQRLQVHRAEGEAGQAALAARPPRVVARGDLDAREAENAHVRVAAGAADTLAQRLGVHLERLG